MNVTIEKTKKTVVKFNGFLNSATVPSTKLPSTGDYTSCNRRIDCYS